MSALLLGAIGLASVGVNAWRSNRLRKQAESGLKELKANPISPYSASPQLQEYYSQALNESRNPMGVSGAERGAFNQNLARQTNTLFKNAIGLSGGNLSRALRGGLNTSTLNQVNQFAQFDAGQRRINRQSALGRVGVGMNLFQNIGDRNAQANLAAQGAYGQAIQQQRENIGNAIGSVGNAAFTGLGYGLGSGKFGADSFKMNNPFGRNRGTGTQPTNYNWQSTPTTGIDPQAGGVQIGNLGSTNWGWD